jgi:hypothetical protein
MIRLNAGDKNAIANAKLTVPIGIISKVRKAVPTIFSNNPPIEPKELRIISTKPPLKL